MSRRVGVRARAGRPPSANRDLALVLGEKTYIGRACRKCRGVERYTKGGSCVHCMRAYAIDARQAFKAQQQSNAEANETQADSVSAAGLDDLLGPDLI